VEDIRFQGRFGVYCRPPGGSNWLFALGAKTMIHETFGFSDMPTEWRGGVENNSESVVVSTRARPAKWPDESKEVRNYLIASDGKYTTGFPVDEMREKEIHTTRFPLPPLETFQVFAVQYRKE